MKLEDFHEPCYKCEPHDRCHKEQTHVHEVVGSVRLAELGEDPHNHRFAGMTGEVIPLPCGRPGEHFHVFKTTSDFYEDHFHPICVMTGVNVKVGEGEDARHVHFIDADTDIEDRHFHEFIVATLIQNPIGD